MLTTQSVDQARRDEGACSDQPGGDFQRCLQTAKAEGAKSQAAAPNHNDQTVTVKPGDTLWGIAQQHGISLGTLLAANPEFNPHKADGVLNFDRSHYGQWDPDYIRPGDHIRLPNHPSQTQHHSSQTQHPQHQHHPSQTQHQPHTRHRPHTHHPRHHHAERHPHLPRHGKPPHGGGHPTPTVPHHQRPPHNPAPTPNPPHHGKPPTSAPTPPPQTAAPTSPATPGKPHTPGGPQAFVPIPLRLIPTKGGAGIENGWKFSKTPTISGEPYGKLSWTLDNTPGRELNLNLKVKYTPRAKVTVRSFDTSSANQTGKKPPLLERLKESLKPDNIKAGLKPEKITVDAGIVVNKRVEGGGSLEIRFGQGKKFNPSAYFSEKDPNNLLVDTAQFKVAKLNPRQLAGSLAKGTWESITQSHSAAQANGRWTPLKDKVWESVKGTEFTLAGEKAVVNPHGPVSGFTNLAGKTTLADIGEALKAPATTPPRFARWSGFGVGTAASFVGGELTDQIVGKRIGNQAVRKAVDGFGAGMSGVVADAVTQKVMPGLVTKAAPVLGKAAPVLSKAGSALRALAPDLGKAGSVLSKLAPDVAKAAPALRVLGKVARIGGPAGAVVAGIPDAVSAVNDFRHGDTVDGWKSIGRGALRVGFTAAGAALGSALGPVGTVAGAVVGGFVGDFFASLF